MTTKELLDNLTRISSITDSLYAMKDDILQEFLRSNKDMEILHLVSMLVKAGCKIDAIKVYRDAHNCTLREAKEYVDSL